MRALEALDGGRLPAGLEGPRAGGWDIEIEGGGGGGGGSASTAGSGRGFRIRASADLRRGVALVGHDRDG